MPISDPRDSFFYPHRTPMKILIISGAFIRYAIWFNNILFFLMQANRRGGWNFILQPALIQDARQNSFKLYFVKLSELLLSRNRQTGRVIDISTTRYWFIYAIMTTSRACQLRNIGFIYLRLILCVTNYIFKLFKTEKRLRFN